MKQQTNDICHQCVEAHNALNGRYCNRLQKYVEYAKEPLCVEQSNMETV